MGFVYAVLGGGRQGTSAAYDMARFGDADEVLIADISLEAAQAAAGRVNRLLGGQVAVAHQVDVTDPAQLEAFLQGVDSFLSAVPYWHNPGVTRVAIRARACMTDLGGNTDLVRQQLQLSPHRAHGFAVLALHAGAGGQETDVLHHQVKVILAAAERFNLQVVQRKARQQIA